MRSPKTPLEILFNMIDKFKILHSRAKMNNRVAIATEVKVMIMLTSEVLHFNSMNHHQWIRLNAEKMMRKANKYYIDIQI